jgi:hypothetical protein
MDETLENCTLQLSHEPRIGGSTYSGMTPAGSPIQLNFQKKSSDAYRAELFLNGNLLCKRNIASDDAQMAAKLLEDTGILDLIAFEYKNLTTEFTGWLENIKPAHFI